MARPLRIEYDAAVYHVTFRGNERKNIQSYGYSQNEIAKQLRIHYSTISRLFEEKKTSKVKT